MPDVRVMCRWCGGFGSVSDAPLRSDGGAGGLVDYIVSIQVCCGRCGMFSAAAVHPKLGHVEDAGFVTGHRKDGTLAFVVAAAGFDENGAAICYPFRLSDGQFPEFAYTVFHSKDGLMVLHRGDESSAEFVKEGDV